MPGAMSSGDHGASAARSVRPPKLGFELGDSTLPVLLARRKQLRAATVPGQSQGRLQPRCGAHDPPQAEREARGRVAVDLALDQVAADAVPRGKPLSFGRIRIEAQQLADARGMVAFELVFPGGPSSDCCPSSNRVARQRVVCFSVQGHDGLPSSHPGLQEAGD